MPLDPESNLNKEMHLIMVYIKFSLYAQCLGQIKWTKLILTTVLHGILLQRI